MNEKEFKVVVTFIPLLSFDLIVFIFPREVMVEVHVDVWLICPNKECPSQLNHGDWIV